LEFADDADLSRAPGLTQFGRDARNEFAMKRVTGAFVVFVLALAAAPAAAAIPAPRPPLKPVPFTTISQRGRLPLERLLTRSRVYYANSFEQAERWLYLLSPSDRQLLLRHDFAHSGVLAIFRRSLVWGQGIQFTSLAAAPNGDLFAGISLAPPPIWCEVKPGEAPYPCASPPPVGTYVLVGVNKAALPAEPQRLYVSESKTAATSGAVGKDCGRLRTMAVFTAAVAPGAGLLAALALAGCGSTHAGAVRAADPPLLVPWSRIGDIALGESRRRVEQDYGSVAGGFHSLGRNSGITQGYYRLHGSRVFEIELIE
jgi:hypothetical protein